MKDQEFEVAKNFKKSQLSQKSMLFTNDIGMFLVKNKHSNYHAIGECLQSIHMCSETLPIDATLELSAIQLIIKSPKELDKNTLEKLSNYGFLFRGGHESINSDDEPVYYTTVLQQVPENFDETFEEFLKTYPDFCQKKYEKIKNSSA